MNYAKKPISTILRSPKTVLTFQDVALIWGDPDPRATAAAAYYYVKTGALVRIRRGIYAKDGNYDRRELAIRIFTPSYVSFETVLTEAGVNFQFTNTITVASYQTRTLVIGGQAYSYKKIKDAVLTNPAGIVHEGEISAASPERAFLDTLYIHTDYHFDRMDALDWDKVFGILPIYRNQRMAQKVREFWKHYQKDL